MTSSDTETSLAKLPHAADLNRAVMLAIESAESREAKAEIRAHIDDFIRMAKGWRDTLDAEFGQQLVKEGDVTVGTTRYFFGYRKKTKNNLPPRPFIERLLELLNGDFDAVARCLASDWCKHGAAKTELTETLGVMKGEEAYNELFTSERVLDVKTGTAKMSVQSLDTRFIEQD